MDRGYSGGARPGAIEDGPCRSGMVRPLRSNPVSTRDRHGMPGILALIEHGEVAHEHDLPCLSELRCSAEHLVCHRSGRWWKSWDRRIIPEVEMAGMGMHRDACLSLPVQHVGAHGRNDLICLCPGLLSCCFHRSLLIRRSGLPACEPTSTA